MWSIFSTNSRSLVAPFVTPPFFDPEIDSNYHYVPTGWVCIVFIVLFGISTCEAAEYLPSSSPSLLTAIISPVVHTVEALYFRLWWLLPTAVLAGLGEILGWSARYWSSLNDGILDTPFLMQYVRQRGDIACPTNDVFNFQNLMYHHCSNATASRVLHHCRALDRSARPSIQPSQAITLLVSNPPCRFSLLICLTSDNKIFLTIVCLVISSSPSAHRF